MLATLDPPVDELAATDLSTLCDAELRERFLEIRRDIDRREAFAARLLAGLHGRGIAAGDGSPSTAAWAQWKTGQRLGDARISLACGQAFELLPLTEKAWSAGEISASAGRTICTGIRDGHETVYTAIESTLVDYAR